ncbi:MAG: hypothetical protein ACYCT9_12655 [Leptospirillum sp.]
MEHRPAPLVAFRSRHRDFVGLCAHRWSSTRQRRFGRLAPEDFHDMDKGWKNESKRKVTFPGRQNRQRKRLRDDFPPPKRARRENNLSSRTRRRSRKEASGILPEPLKRS